MRYYAADNSYGSSTSHGFANTWFVVVFDNKESRDAWVEQSNNLTRKAIKREEVIKYSRNYDMTQNRYHEPKLFTREYWGIDSYGLDTLPSGAIGTIEVCDEYSGNERFYN